MTHEEIRLRREEIRKEAQSGEYTIADLSLKWGLSYGTIRSYCSGIKLSRTIIPSTYGIIADLINTDIPLREVGKKHGVAFSQVYQVSKSLIGAGVKIKVRHKGG